VAIARVQLKVFATGGSSSSARTAAFTSNVTAGNLIVVTVGTFNGTSATVTDSLSNSYTLAASASSKAQVWYAQNITGGACTVTVTPSGGDFVNFMAIEYSGAKTSSVLDTTATGSNSVGPLTVAAGDVVVGMAGGSTSNATAVTSSTTAIIATTHPDQASSCLEWFSVAAGSVTLTTDATASYAAAAFKAVSPPGGGLMRSAGMGGGINA